MDRRKPLANYLKLEYPFRVRVPPEGGYYVDFPDLPGIMTDADSLQDLGTKVDEARSFWIEGEYEAGRHIPAPTIWDYENEYSGKFNVRLPSSLHAALAEGAERQGVSLNQYVVALLSRGDTQARIEQRLDTLEETLSGGRGATHKVAEEQSTYTVPRRKTASPKKAGASPKPRRSTKQ